MESSVKKDKNETHPAPRPRMSSRGSTHNKNRYDNIARIASGTTRDAVKAKHGELQ